MEINRRSEGHVRLKFRHPDGKRQRRVPVAALTNQK
jgi:hypothetical protein